MLDLDMRNPVLDYDLPPNVATRDEIDLADTLLERLKERFLASQWVARTPTSAPG